MSTVNSTESQKQPSQASAGQGAGSGRTRSNLEVFILCHNEEVNVPHALKSVCDWADAVYVVDSNSTDRTREIAEQFGAKVVVQKWLGYAQQKNWALKNLPLKADWTFILDADESITPELKAEILAITTRPATQVREAGFYVNRLTYFMSRPLYHCGYFPSYNLRLFKRGTAHYEQREVHEHMIVDGPTARMKQIMLHDDRRGLEHYIAKHNRYSTLEARALIREAKLPPSADPAARERGIAFRRWLKRRVLPNLPLSPVWRFVYMYILRLGVLDGLTGLRFCAFIASYDFFILLKLKEARMAEANGEGAVVKSIGGLAVAEGAATTADASPTSGAGG